MQYVWQHRLFSPIGLSTVDGRRLNVINTGQLNTASGPDFFNASVEIDGQKWIGNVEIHVRASDWHRHNHHKDPAYDSVILHVVDYDDMAIRRPDGQIIPQLRMPCSPHLNLQFRNLTDCSPAEVTCAHIIPDLPKLYLTDWISSLAYERIYSKVDRINELLKSNNGNWEETCYIILARSLGFNTNNEPFERLARSLPLRFLRKHADSLTSVEALLFGQAGVLEKALADAYVERLRGEYSFLATKFGLKPPANLNWKFSGVRPQSFPYRRIALLAQLIYNGFSLMSSIMEASDVEKARDLFKIRLSGYWSRHFTFGSFASESDISFSDASADILIINTLVPLLYAYATSVGDYEKADCAVEMLHQIKGEHNRLVTMFSKTGIKVRDAFTSQALIQLRKEYCEKRKCLYCRIGHKLLAAKAIRRD